MESKSNYNNDKLEFRQIVLLHIKKILEISSSELRDKTIQITHSNHTTTMEKEDTRESYIQAIENLAYVLIPYFDKKMTKVYDECILVINALGHELRGDILKDEYVRICNEIGEDKTRSGFKVEMKLRYAKKLFRELNLLLNRNDYLKSSVYGEDRDEVVDSDEEDVE